MSGHGGARPGSGPPRLPDAVKKARGTYRADRSNPSAVRLQRAPLPEPPSDLDAHAQAWWRSLAKAVALVGVYTEADADTFRLLVESRALLAAAHAGRVVEDKGDMGGYKAVSVSSIVSLTRCVSNLLTRFGLDPSSRDRLIPAPTTQGAEIEADPDDFEPLQ